MGIKGHFIKKGAWWGVNITKGVCSVVTNSARVACPLRNISCSR